MPRVPRPLARRQSHQPDQRRRGLSSLRLCPPGCATTFTSCIECLKSRVAGGGKPAAVAKAGAKAGAKTSAKAVPPTPAKPAPPKATPAKKGAGPKAMV